MDWEAHRSCPDARGPGPGSPPAKNPEGGSPGAEWVRAWRLGRRARRAPVLRLAAHLVLAPSAPAVIRLWAAPGVLDRPWLVAGAG